MRRTISLRVFVWAILLICGIVICVDFFTSQFAEQTLFPSKEFSLRKIVPEGTNQVVDAHRCGNYFLSTNTHNDGSDPKTEIPPDMIGFILEQVAFAKDIHRIRMIFPKSSYEIRIEPKTIPTIQYMVTQPGNLSTTKKIIVRISEQDYKQELCLPAPEKP
jgi:hypothetical protein